ncbi:MAG: ribosomal L7Ae/L30e/S12e/Gadd45 family protein [Gemmatimonadetes bacterium]|nr:ribosomal L7Ae/L30e/S12e/Gadd45 family protein [Gemmatimonadota bacterium]
MTGAKGKADAFRLLGLARRAGAVVPGIDGARRTLQEGKARLILMADDASGVQLDKIRRLLDNRSIPQARLGDRATLGAAIGTGPVSAIAVTVATFAQELQRRLGAATEDAAPEQSEE